MKKVLLIAFLFSGCFLANLSVEAASPTPSVTPTATPSPTPGTLVNRLMGLNDDGTPMAGNPTDPTRPKIEVHLFHALAGEVAEGRLSKADVKSHFNMNDADGFELDQIANLLPPSPTQGQKSAFVFRILNTFIAAECRCVDGYTTPTEVRTALGL